MAFDPSAIRSIEQRRYVLEHAPSILCALIVRRASSDPKGLIDDAIETANTLFDMIDPPRPVQDALSANSPTHSQPNVGVSGTA